LQRVAEQLVALCGYIVEHWSKFEVGSDGYGDVRARYLTLQQAFSSLPADTQTERHE
jgi:hypothetical protein